MSTQTFDWSLVEPRYRALLERDVRSVQDLEQWLRDRDALDVHVDEAGARIYDRTCTHTSDADAKRAYAEFFEKIHPQVVALRFELDEQLVDSPFAAQLDPREYGVLLRDRRADVALFRQENLALVAQDDMLGARHGELVGAMQIELDGELLPIAAADVRFESLDADVRRGAWSAAMARRLEDANALDELFAEQVALRDRMARNAGCAGYQELAFQKLRRFDYGVAECEAFHAGVEEHFVPLQEALWAGRRERLGTPTLRPWDTRVSIDDGPPLAPFETVDELVEGTSRTFHALDPELGALFDTLRDGASLDLDSRPGKAPGGYQNDYPESQRCFIFMNAVGVSRDVETLLHEGGHAFHTLLANAQPLYANRETEAEFSEVASMAMELLTHPYLGAFYDEVDARRARTTHLERIVALFPWIALGDAFQHWVYAHPGCAPDERVEAWRALDRRFRPGIDWTSFEREQGREWQRVPHFFTVPFYYIDYGIAQLGALGLWQRSLEGEADALARYKSALRLGGSRTLPELFAAAGLEFDLGPAALGRAAGVLRDALGL